jgi:Ca2+-transporting ATPase
LPARSATLPSSDPPPELTQQEAASRLAQDGPNELPSAQPRSLLAIAGSVVREPMFLLLIACGAIYLLLGDRGEALMLLAFVFVILAITFAQERKTERALDALRDLSSPRALVIRSGQQERIAGREVVRGDLLVVAEGDRVPADAVLLSGVSVTADESMLSGESVPVRKAAAERAPSEMQRPGGDDLPFLYSGTLVVQGKGLASVIATGAHTEIGRIGRALESVAQQPTGVQRETRRVVTRVAWFGVALSLAVALVYGMHHGEWLQGVLAGITLSMAILPEELPVVLTIFLGLGAWRIAEQHVLTRRIPVIEMLGAATVLCTDKTGTLTQNRMQLSCLCVEDRLFELAQDAGSGLPEEFHELLEFSILASRREPFDPMEKAIQEAAQATLAGTEHMHGDWELMDEYPLSTELLAMSRVWRSPGHDRYVIAVKGAPEAIGDLCHLAPAAIEALERRVLRMAGEGLRVIGVAKAAFGGAALPGNQHDFQFEFIGLLGLADPVREAVPAAIRECRAAGIRVVMITGDYPATAMNVAQRIGLPLDGGSLTGRDLDALNDEALRRRVGDVNIFCRVAPEQKLRLVEAFKAGGSIVAMTGDGVNDAPALKAAHIGVAMGGRGTDVAREAASLVLLDDDFSSIVRAIRQGRRIFDNLGKAIAFVIAVHVPIVGMSLIPVLLGLPLVLMPVHILFLQLIIDPACSIVFEAEPEEPDVMQRPPRPSGAALFSRATVMLGLLQGCSLLAVVAAVYGSALYRGQGAEDARTLTFATMVMANLGLIFANRSRSRSLRESLDTRNRALWWVTGGALVFLAIALYVPGLRGLFYFGPLHADDIALVVLATALCTAGFEAAKLIRGSAPHTGGAAVRK